MFQCGSQGRRGHNEDIQEYRRLRHQTQERPHAHHHSRPCRPYHHQGVSRFDPHTRPERGGTRDALRRTPQLGSLLSRRPARRNSRVHQGKQRIYGKHSPHVGQQMRNIGALRPLPPQDVSRLQGPRCLPHKRHRARRQPDIRLRPHQLHDAAPAAREHPPRPSARGRVTLAPDTRDLRADRPHTQDTPRSGDRRTGQLLQVLPAGRGYGRLLRPHDQHLRMGHRGRRADPRRGRRQDRVVPRRAAARLQQGRLAQPVVRGHERTLQALIRRRPQRPISARQHTGAQPSSCAPVSFSRSPTRTDNVLCSVWGSSRTPPRAVRSTPRGCMPAAWRSTPSDSRP